DGRGRAAYCAKSTPPGQGANPGNDVPDTGAQFVTENRGAGAMPRRVGQLLRVLPNAPGAHKSGSVDPPKITLISLAAVGEWAQPLQGTAPSWRIAVQGSGRRRFTKDRK